MRNITYIGVVIAVFTAVIVAPFTACSCASGAGAGACKHACCQAAPKNTEEACCCHAPAKFDEHAECWVLSGEQGDKDQKLPRCPCAMSQPFDRVPVVPALAIPTELVHPANPYVPVGVDPAEMLLAGTISPLSGAPPPLSPHSLNAILCVWRC